LAQLPRSKEGWCGLGLFNLFRTNSPLLVSGGSSIMARKNVPKKVAKKIRPKDWNKKLKSLRKEFAPRR
jgi:hypothetical protein